MKRSLVEALGGNRKPVREPIQPVRLEPRIVEGIGPAVSVAAQEIRNSVARGKISSVQGQEEFDKRHRTLTECDLRGEKIYTDLNHLVKLQEEGRRLRQLNTSS